jgi:thiamine biosynthesis protein ThiS
LKLSINGEDVEADYATLGEWADVELGNANGINGIAVAVNDSIVPDSQWLSFALHDGDKILVVAAAQGG